KSKYHTLSAAETAENLRIARDRMLIENIIAKFKVFKILSNKYRNRRKRYNLRMTLICSIYNKELHT
ncbi:MAG: IS5/IS1182 family transposase, partial [Nitrososphaerota archaeon]|nr:IS5/IS1182 family transposase [Nitrososphaerota archaeon]